MYMILTKHEFRAIRIRDKISISTGYDIKDRNEELICALRNLILPEGKLLEHVLSKYARCLCRNTPEYFRVMTGKSPLDELIKYAFGEYGNISPQTEINQATETFTFTDTSILNPDNSDPYYRSFEFRIKYRSPIMWILFDTYKKYNGQIYNLPNNISTDPILRWFRKNYEECEILEDPNTYLANARSICIIKKR